MGARTRPGARVWPAQGGAARHGGTAGTAGAGVTAGPDADAPAPDAAISEVLLACTVAATDLAMIVTGTDGLITVFNAEAERLLGYHAAEVVGRHTADVFYLREEVEARAAALGVPADLAALSATPHGAAGFRHWTYLRKDGGRVSVHVTLSPVHGGGGEVLGHLHVARDISADEAAVAALRLGYERERTAVVRMREFDRIKDEAIAVASHDLRTPLTSLISYHQLILEDADLTEDQRHLITVAHRNAHRVLTLADGLLAIAKMEADGPVLNRWPVPLDDVLRGSLEALAGAIDDRRLNVAIVPLGGIVVDADAFQLERVLTNLLSNAVKFTPDGGLITFVARRTDAVVEIRISDSGVGIAAEELPHVFDRFFRSRRTKGSFSGTGLGLAITKAIVEAHGGAIAVSSRPDIGSTFTLTIPDTGSLTESAQVSGALADILAALRRVRLPDLERAWAVMLGRAGLAGDETDRRSAERMLDVLSGFCPVARVVGLSQRIRADSPGYGHSGWYDTGPPDPRLSEAVNDLIAPLTAPERIRTVARYDLRDPGLRERLDGISRRTATRLEMPTGLVSIVLDGAQFFAGAHGLAGWMAQIRGTPVEWAFCAHAMLARAPYVVTDAATHPAHLSSPLVTVEGTRAYAGAQLVEPGGQVLGMHCVAGPVPRTFTGEQLAELRRSAEEIVAVLEEYRIDAAPGGREWWPGHRGR